MADNDLNIGNRLLKARREKRIHISLAAKDLCIPKRFLSAFEKNDTSSLPEPIYAVGFMRTYADYLGLDPDPLVEDLKQTFNNEPDQTETRPQNRTSNATLLGVMLFLALAASLGYFGFTSMARPEYKVTNDSGLPQHITALLEDDEGSKKADDGSKGSE